MPYLPEHMIQQSNSFAIYVVISVIQELVGLFQSSVFAHKSSGMAYPAIAVVCNVPGQQGQSLFFFFFTNIDFIFGLLLTIQLLCSNIGSCSACKYVQLTVMQDKTFFFF